MEAGQRVDVVGLPQAPYPPGKVRAIKYPGIHLSLQLDGKLFQWSPALDQLLCYCGET